MGGYAAESNDCRRTLFLKRGFHRPFVVLAMLAGGPATWVAQADTGIESPGKDPIRGEIEGRNARVQGIQSLQAGNYFSAAAAFREAARHGDADSMRHLGDMAFAGKGVAQNYEQAIHWYCQAALAGSLSSARHLSAVDLGGWSESRDSQGWEAACERWLRPKPPSEPVETQTNESAPEVRIEVRVEEGIAREEPETYILWPGHLHPSKQWRRRGGNPFHPPPMPLPPDTSKRRQRLGNNPLFPPPMPLLRRGSGYGSKSFKR